MRQNIPRDTSSGHKTRLTRNETTLKALLFHFQLEGSGFLTSVCWARRAGGRSALSRHRLLPRDRAETLGKRFLWCRVAFTSPSSRRLGGCSCSRVSLMHLASERRLKANQLSCSACKRCNTKGAWQHFKRYLKLTSKTTHSHRQCYRTTIMLLQSQQYYCCNIVTIATV